MTNAIVLITGGTGTFGKAFAEKCLAEGVKEVRIFSRDEKKQYEMQHQYNDPRLSFFIGDIRDKNSLNVAMTDVDYVFHAGAMKQVPTCEQYPLEAIKTNILGSTNVLDSAIEHGVKKIICLSTDKAVYPTSSMGLTKSLMEKVALQKAMEQNQTIICVTRFCNLIVSNGSVVPLFIN
jgi:UDP-glucose 4-epimerase